MTTERPPPPGGFLDGGWLGRGSTGRRPPAPRPATWPAQRQLTPPAGIQLPVTGREPDRADARPAGARPGGGGDTEVPITRDDDVVRVRQAVRTAAVAAKLSLVDQTKLVTAASELARNTLIYGGGGVVRIEQVSGERRTGVRVRFVDQGPGISDLDLAFTDGYTTGGGLGLGLSGARRLVDEFDIQSTVGVGTEITVTKWAR